jgi:UDP-2,3-diacylglucosamine hydrolase
MPSGSSVFFISDAHLGAEPEEQEAARESRLHAFLTWLPSRASHLYIVGDLFDFWFEYPNAIPRRSFATLAALRALRAAGVEIHYLNGNHDFWLGPFLSRELDLRTHHGGLAATHQDRRIWLHHGDGLVGGDFGYRALKRVIRHPVSIGLYRLLHPDIGFPLAHWCARVSRRSRQARPPAPERLWREIAAPRFAEGFDAVVVGHFHRAYERREAGRAFFVLGDWIDQFTYVTLQGGDFRLAAWPHPEAQNQADSDRR